jgi:NDP-sugar pyrophosphorylase family protein/aminoglycoside/choline kinase family phosphotransferase
MAERAGCGFVLAAGFGRRLLPLTRRLPKCLLPWVGAESLLAAAVAQLRAAGLADVAANAHHLAEQVEAYAAAVLPGLRIFHEPELLGTGGALANARAWLAQSPWFVVRNADVVDAAPLAPLIAAHGRASVLATLRLAEWSEANSVLVDADGWVRDVAGRLGVPAGPGWRRLTYTGIGCFAREALALLPPGISSLVDLLERVLREQPRSVRGETIGPDAGWADLGTLDRYLDRIGRELGGGDWLFDPARRARSGGSRLRRCVVLPDARVSADLTVERAVIGDGWVVTADDNRVLGDRAVQAAGFGPETELEPLAGAGSDRRFYRLRSGERRAVAMLTHDGDPDRDRTAAAARFLATAGCGGPDLLAAGLAPGPVLLEDLGDRQLRRVWKDDRPAAETAYAALAELLVTLQLEGLRLARRSCPLAHDRRLGPASLRWETRYFCERFLGTYARLAARDWRGLESGLRALSAAVARQPRVLIHRDLQSENVLVTPAGPRLVDVQGLRIGPLGYDIASLAFDPYVDPPADWRNALATRWRERLSAACAVRLARDASGAKLAASLVPPRWRCVVVAAGMQRLMQALGAFAYLALVKGKRRFLEPVPRGVALLCGLLAEADALSGESELADDPLRPPRLPRLAGLLERIRSRA